MTSSHPQPLASISDAVGHTPIVSLQRLFPHASVVAKIESMNPGGSTKDRPALAMLREAWDSGKLTKGGTVIESSSGNLGISLARSCALMGVRFVCVVDARANRSTVAAIRALGAQIEEVTEPDPETGDLLTARLTRVRELVAATPGAVNLNQYANPANPAAHEHGTMREIAQAVDDIDTMVAATSTTGTIGGCSSYIRAHGLATTLVAVDAEGSVLFGGKAGTRRLPGMGAGFETELSKRVSPDRVMRVSEVDCVAGARLLARYEGILAGASSGAVVASIARLLQERPDAGTIAMLVHDGGVPYLDTVFNDEWVRENLGVSAAQLETHMRALVPDVGGA